MKQGKKPTMLKYYQVFAKGIKPLSPEPHLSEFTIHKNDKKS